VQEVLKKLISDFTVFWFVTPCSLVEVLEIRGNILPPSFTMKDKTEGSSERSVHINQSTRRHILQDRKKVKVKIAL
jgi:hypothetical protein